MKIPWMSAHCSKVNEQRERFCDKQKHVNVSGISVNLPQHRARSLSVVLPIAVTTPAGQLPSSPHIALSAQCISSVQPPAPTAHPPSVEFAQHVATHPLSATSKASHGDGCGSVGLPCDEAISIGQRSCMYTLTRGGC